MGDLIGYARVSTADQDPRMQLDALSAENCLKTYTDTATGTKADRPQWNTCLADLRPGDTLVIWKIDRLGRNLRDLVTALGERHVEVRSLTNGIVDTTTAHGKLVFGMFALMAEYEAALIQERTQAGLVAARARGRQGGRSVVVGGCLACTVGPEDGGHLPMASSPRHTLKGSGCAKSLGKIAHSHSHGLGHGGVRTSRCMTGVTSVGDESKATLTR